MTIHEQCLSEWPAYQALSCGISRIDRSLLTGYTDDKPWELRVISSKQREDNSQMPKTTKTKVYWDHCRVYDWKQLSVLPCLVGSKSGVLFCWIVSETPIEAVEAKSLKIRAC